MNTHTYERRAFFRTKKNTDLTLELEANQFAAELLMPSSLLEKHLSKLDTTDEEEFKVSTIAMQLRLQKYFAM